MRIPKTPVEFDYDLWTTEDGKCIVRIKATGVPVSGCEDETATLLSLDYVSYQGGSERSSEG